MSWRATLLSAVLAAGLTLSFVSRASADPPPWAGKWRHHHEKHDWDHGHHWRYYRHHQHDYWRDRDDRSAWRPRWNDHDRDDGYYYGRRYYGPRYGWNDRYHRYDR